MAATNNPLADTASTTTISSLTLPIAGILVTIHGLSELPPSATKITCLWLLNPRLQTKETMAPIAAQIISTWNATAPHNTTTGLIAAAFDQRNHGTRLVDPLHNEAWRQGNPRHAQDMFGCFHGTATDMSQLMDHLGSYIFPAVSSPLITNHMVLGISLGGHAAWHALLSDPRVSAAVVGIGCPDYTRLMTDRARLSKLPSYISTTPPGVSFLGSPDFPPALLDAIARYDPAGLFLPGVFNPTAADADISPQTLLRFRTLVQDRLQGKRILNLSGGDDKLVPYAAGKVFLDTLKRVLREDGGLDVGFEDVIFEGVGHSFPGAMVEKAASFVCDLLAKEERGDRRGSRM